MIGPGVSDFYKVQKRESNYRSSSRWEWTLQSWAQLADTARGTLRLGTRDCACRDELEVILLLYQRPARFFIVICVTVFTKSHLLFVKNTVIMAPIHTVAQNGFASGTNQFYDRSLSVIQPFVIDVNSTYPQCSALLPTICIGFYPQRY